MSLGGLVFLGTISGLFLAITLIQVAKIADWLWTVLDTSELVFITAIGVLIALVLGTGCAHPGDAFEAACIKGRLSQAQADEINLREWDRRPGYCYGETYTDDDGVVREGQAHCDAEPGDRVLVAGCSLAASIFRHGD